jgi:hypothetical protein
MHLTNYFPTPNHCGASWDELHPLVARLLSEGTIVGHDGDGWLVAYLEGRHIPNQPDALVVYFSYAQDCSACSIGAENFSGLGWLPNEPIDADWYESLPHPKKFTKHNSVQIDGSLIAYSYRGKQYHYADSEIAAAKKLKPLFSLHDLLEEYDIIVLKNRAGFAVLETAVTTIAAKWLSANCTFKLECRPSHLELVATNLVNAKRTRQQLHFPFTRQAFEDALAALDHEVQVVNEEKEQTGVRLTLEEWEQQFSAALAQLQPGVTTADLSFPYRNFFHDGWQPYKAAQELIACHVLRPELAIFTRPLLEPSTNKPSH